MQSLTPHPSPAPGFALVMTMILLALLLMVTVGLLSLSSISLRSASRDSASQQAHANARLAMQLALGRLQLAAGPDQRVTAPSSIGAKRAQSRLTGVWQGWKWNGDGAAPNWKTEKSKRFIGWLVSSPDPRLTQQESFADSDPPGDTIRLVSATAQGDPAVEAAVVKLARGQQAYAWAVFDESQKTSISLATDEALTFANHYDRAGAAGSYGFRAVTARDWTLLADKKADHSKRLTPGQARLAGLAPRDISFHDLTSGSMGLLTNVADGGLALDLSRLFDSPTLPATHASRFIYSGKDTPLVMPPVRDPGVNPLPSPDPSWAMLFSHYRTYTKLTGGTAPCIDGSVTSVTARPSAATPAAQILRHKAFNEQQLAPVIAKAQFVFSVAFGYNAETLNQMRAEGSARISPPELRDNYITWIAIDPVITLWNPYNVPMRFTGARVELYRIPLAFRLYKNGNLINSEYTKLTNAHTPADFKTRAGRFYRLNILPEAGSSERMLAPGEHVVFTAHDHKMHAGHEYSITGVTLRPGFHPPAGNASNLEVGGVTTQNILVDSTGASSGRDYGKTVRTVAVKAGDRIQIEITPQRAGIDNFSETGGREVTGFLKYYLGGANVARLLGGIELDYGTKEKDLLPHFPPDDLPTIVVSPDIPLGDTAGMPPSRQALRWKEPFMLATFQEKTERDSRFPSRSWIDNSPGGFYASAGIDQDEDFANHQYEFKWEVMTDWPPNSPTIEISNEGNRGYGGSGIYAQSGTEFATFASLPLWPAHSLAQLRHAPLNVGGQLPLTTQIIANSFAPPLLGENRVRAEAGTRTYLDHSYFANNALFDSWFLSSVADHPALPGTAARSAGDLLAGFFLDGKSLPNRRFRPHTGGANPAQLAAHLKFSPDSYREIAAHLVIDAPFNVNSTSVAAWQALLASNFGAAAPLIAAGSLQLHSGQNLPVLRHSHVTAGDFETTSGAQPSDHAKWNGYRRLNPDRIARLAAAIVVEVKKRAPFQSLAEFVNRRPGGGELSRNGALQAAIENSAINDNVLDASRSLPSGGNTADGAPGVINQADILTPLAPQLVARGDTFRIRAYGEAADGTAPKARAWCEAVVQRVPEFIDSTTDSSTASPTSTVNLTFGRRFEIVSFRWLKPEEI